MICENSVTRNLYISDFQIDKLSDNVHHKKDKMLPYFIGPDMFILCSLERIKKL